MRVSLAWGNTDDLDLHVVMSVPGQGNADHIYFGAKSGVTGRSHGVLDVDMNVVSPVRDAVENVRWRTPPPAASYLVLVHQFTKRESIDVGFTVEVEAGGNVQTYRYDRALTAKEQKQVLKITVERDGRDGRMRLEPGEGVVAGASPQEKWGLRTLGLVRVNSVLLSPNHWQEPGDGNKHWFFILEGCRNPEPTRGFYNEFLHPRLHEHRKVFEVLADKMKCAPVDTQLSGLGFSETRKDRVTVVAMGPSSQRAYTIVFGQGG